MTRPLILFDMDGVITSEDGYWRAAACALYDLAAHLGHRGAQSALKDHDLPWRLDPHLPTIAQVKSLLISTNWDLCHLAAMALLARLAAASPANAAALRAVDWTTHSPAAALIWPAGLDPEPYALLQSLLPHAGEHRGFALLSQLAARIPELQTLLERKGPVWQWLFQRFQIWFNGTAGAAADGVPTIGLPERPGILHREGLVRPPEAIRAALQRLQTAGYTLGVATGRTRAELLPTLARHALLPCFEPTALVTHDEVAAAERELGPAAHLSKPHPFPFLRALFPSLPSAELAHRKHPPLPIPPIIVGDTVADMSAAHTLGARAVAVLTGPAGAAATASLQAAGATDVLDDVLALPALLHA